MCEVNARNLKHLYPEIKKRLQDSKFISIDTEFSALEPLEDQKASLFDTPAKRYSKLKANLETVIPLQVGLTAFSFDPEKNSYFGKVYTFYVQPACFQYIHRNFYLQTSTISFLRLYKFDFNKFAYDGIPFMNRDQESKLKDKLFNNEVSEINTCCKNELEDVIEKDANLVRAWYVKAQVGDTLTIPNACSERHSNEETLFFIHKAFRDIFDNLWTYIENGEFIVKKVSKEDYQILCRKYQLEAETIDNLLGFTKVFRLLTTLKKPIVGHNIYQDLLLMLSSFETALPEKYNDFKSLVSELLPVIFDTKSISYELKPTLPEGKQWVDRGLSTIFDYFKNGIGRTLSTNSPAIDVEDIDQGYGEFHNAGWDSFCTGYVFIRLAHLNIYRKYPSSKQFVSSELISGLEPYKNRINVIRGSTSYIHLDKADPESRRPPHLLIESLKNRPVDIAQVTTLLSTFGFIEIRRLPYQKHRALIAVDNYGNARRILEMFKANPDYRISKYNFLSHSPVIKGVLVSSLAISSAAILWLTYTVIKR